MLPTRSKTVQKRFKNGYCKAVWLGLPGNRTTPYGKPVTNAVREQLLHQSVRVKKVEVGPYGRMIAKFTSTVL